MSNFALASGFFLSLFFILLFSAYLGRCFGKWQISRSVIKKVEVLNVAEGAVFALLGLLVAFTFTGAYERFEARKIYIIEEANAIDTAYLSLGLLTPQVQPELRATFRDYLDARLAIYKKIPTLRSIKNEMEQYNEIKIKLWSEVLTACHATNNVAATIVLVQAVGKMFDIAYTQVAVIRVHPPVIIFLLLIGLAALSSFLAGYSTAGSRYSNALYLISYVAITAFTIYVVIDLELPRVGMIRVDRFDKILSDIKTDLK